LDAVGSRRDSGIGPATFIDLTRDRVARGFTSGECERYFVYRCCPSLERLTGNGRALSG